MHGGNGVSDEYGVIRHMMNIEAVDTYADIDRVWKANHQVYGAPQDLAFVLEVFARKIVGWRVSTAMTMSFVLDALNQAICQRCPDGG